MSGITEKGVHYSIQQITPKLAEEWLGHNTHNRNVVQRRVREYAETIRRGEWLLTGDPIRFAKGGDLLDGQHRLLAVVEADKGIQSLVITNLPGQVQDTVDTGIKRTFAHVLQIRGYKRTSVLAAATRNLHAYRVAGVFDTRGVDEAGHQQLLNVLHRNAGLQESVKLADRFHYSGLMFQSGWATMHYAITEKYDAEVADQFFDNLLDHGYGGESKRDPVVQLRKRLLQSQQSQRKLSPRMKNALTVKAFNAWMLGETPPNLRWRAGGPDPEQFPALVGKDQAS